MLTIRRCFEMKKILLGMVAFAVMLPAIVEWTSGQSNVVCATEQKTEEIPPPDLYKDTPAWYQAVYKDNVGLSEGSGPFTKYFKAQMLDMYWQPNRHYEPMENLDHSIFIEQERRDLCVICHEEATPGIVADWRSSGHKHPKST